MFNSHRRSAASALAAHSAHWRNVAIGLVVCLGLGVGLRSFAATPPEKRQVSEPNAVIAAYLVNFVRYIEWPESVPPAGEPWRIGILNAENLRGPLDRIAEGKIVRGRPIIIVHATDPAALRDCQIVLLPSSADNPALTAKALADRPILTVLYHDKDTAAATATIELVLLNRNIRYRLNAGLLAAQGLRATPGLLENALPTAATPVQRIE